jgi:hypothetical protein
MNSSNLKATCCDIHKVYFLPTVEKVADGQVFVRVLRFSYASIIAPTIYPCSLTSITDAIDSIL